MIKIYVLTSDMTSRSYFGKMNSTLGSVVPLAMFGFIVGLPFIQGIFSMTVFRGIFLRIVVDTRY